MVSSLFPLTTPHQESTKTFGAGDILVIFGEVFNRGYVNGLISAAEKRGMKVIYSTVGRRDKDNCLRPLTPEELASMPQPLINIPLEAGFDFERATPDTPHTIDQLKDVKSNSWQETSLRWDLIDQSKGLGTQRFRGAVRSYLKELDGLISAQSNVLFVHTMAGGIPRAKILMPLLNRIVKGKGERHLSSEAFWKSDLGKLCELSFNEVTAETLKYLLEESAPLREKIKQRGKQVGYVAYGYHGTEVLIEEKFQWQTYTPYIQGWAKKNLENVALDFSRQGVPTTVFNCPEILTNSSSIFQGVELSLFPLIDSLMREAGSRKETLQRYYQSFLKDELTLEQLKKSTDKYFTDPLIKSCCQFDSWPCHNNLAQMELMLDESNFLTQSHKDGKNLLTFNLSEKIIEASGNLMLQEAAAPRNPVEWIGHSVLTEEILRTSHWNL